MTRDRHLVRLGFRSLAFVLVLVAATLLTAPACDRGRQATDSGPQTVTQSRKVMSTFAALTAVAPTRKQALAAIEAGYARLDELEQAMSVYRENSEVSLLNRQKPGEALVTSDEVFTCLQNAMNIAEASGGAFDITCRPYIKLWKRCNAEARLPTDEERAETAKRVGWKRVQLSPETKGVTLSVEGLEIDLGGIAKGYALDLAAKAMTDAGATSGIVDVGGDVVTIGRRSDGKPWRVGVLHPFEEGIILTLDLSDQAVATSGLQQRFFEIDGKRYSHIIDPRTGMPAEEAPCVTVIAPDGMTADAWATVFSVLSVDEGKAMCVSGKTPPLEVMWITGTAEEPIITKTPGFDAFVVE